MKDYTDEISAKIFYMLKDNKLHNSILVYGSAGVGKSYFVRSIVKKIFGQLISSDLLMLAKEAITIEDIRQAIDFSAKTPLSPYKVLVVDSLDAMSNNGLNALLKLVEEPQDSLYIFLVSKNLFSVPATLKSRCLKLYIPRPDLQECLRLLPATTVAESVIRYLHQALEGDMNAINSILACSEVVEEISKDSVDIAALSNILATSNDKNIFKIILFEFAQKVRLAHASERLSLLQDFEHLNKEYNKIARYNLNPSNAVFSLVNNLHLEARTFHPQ